MGVEVSYRQTAAPIEEVVFSCSLGTRKLTFRQDPPGAQRVTISLARWTTTKAVRAGATPTSLTKTAAFPNEVRELANALLRLADSIEAE